MSQNLQIGTTTYAVATQGETGGTWGEDTAAWMDAITDKVNSISSNYDILPSTASLTNNQSSAANISGLSFNTSLIRSAEIDITVRRTAVGVELSEMFKILVVYESTAAAWLLSEESVGDASGITFSITAAGQIQYVSTDISSSSCTAKFRARVVEA